MRGSEYRKAGTHPGTPEPESAPSASTTYTPEIGAMTDDEMAQIAWFLRRQLLVATPETYAFQRAMIRDMYGDFRRWFIARDPDFLPDRFEDLIFNGYPEDLYSG